MHGVKEFGKFSKMAKEYGGLNWHFVPFADINNAASTNPYNVDVDIRSECGICAWIVDQQMALNVNSTQPQKGDWILPENETDTILPLRERTVMYVHGDHVGDRFSGFHLFILFIMKIVHISTTYK